jgi:hypothetical protein
LCLQGCRLSSNTEVWKPQISGTQNAKRETRNASSELGQQIDYRIRVAQILKQRVRQVLTQLRSGVEA